MRDPNDNFSNETVTARLGGGGSRIRNITMRGHGGGLAAPAGAARRRGAPPPAGGGCQSRRAPVPRPGLAGRSLGDRQRATGIDESLILAVQRCPLLTAAWHGV